MDARYYLGFCLLGLCLYSGIVGSQRSSNIPKILRDPTTFANRTLQLAYVRVVQVLGREFHVEQLGAKMAVRVAANLDADWEVWRQRLQVGDDVSVLATFHPERYLLLHEMHIHRGRQLKIWVSILALAFLAGVLFNERLKASPEYA